MDGRITRRDFMGAGMATLAAAALGPAILTSGCANGQENTLTNAGPNPNGPIQRRPNILLVLVDEYRRSPDYPDGTGQVSALREILRFDPLTPGNPFVNYFPALTRLRQNSVVLRTHYVASAACVPSRASMLTGQYPTVHGVSQTTGFFKNADDPGFVFLDHNGIPTIGDWFQAAGYETHYFGKWHISEACNSLAEWGFPFGNWDGPEPHGSDPANLGVFRDPEFATDTVNFLNSKAKSNSDTPWFAVTSYLAPHDISGWPMQWFLPGGVGVQDFPGRGVIPDIPGPGVMSNPGNSITPTSCPPPNSPPINLNPLAYPQGTFSAAPTFGENLRNGTKPDCQFDMSYKIGLCQKSILPAPLRPLAPNPFQLQGADFEAWTTKYGEWGCYLHMLFDHELNRVFQALDANGQAENTIVIFTSDHGDYGGAHGGCVQKWHTAYEEATRVPVVVSSPLVNPTNSMREIEMPTSHIDLLPTLLGLAGFGPAEQAVLRSRISGQGVVPPLVGTDLSPFLTNPGAPPLPRPGVLFITEDEITQMTSINPANQGFDAYNEYLQLVDRTILTTPGLAPGPVVQPNLVRSLFDGVWKYSRYYDPNGVAADQFELYHLPSDPIEATNLVDFRTGLIRAGVSVPGLTGPQLEAKKTLLAQQLAQQEAALL